MPVLFCVLWIVGFTPAATPATAPASAPARIEGVVTAAQTRPMKPPRGERDAALLKPYEEPAEGFAWSMQRRSGLPTHEIFDVQFPSPVVTPTPENNTVHGEYYRCRGAGKRPAVVVLHILDGRFRESRLVCGYLATQGMNSILVKMAYYGPRRPTDPQHFRALTQNLDTLIEGTRQSVMDARRAARWLATLPEVDPDRISILGTSLGGFVGSVASGVDGRFTRSVFILAGGGLDQVLTTREREVRTVREAIQTTGLTREELTRRLVPIEPLTFAGRIDPATVLMVNTREDPIVPPACAEALAGAIGPVDLQWYEGDHYALIWKLPAVLAQVARHLDTQPSP